MVGQPETIRDFLLEICLATAVISWPVITIFALDALFPLLAIQSNCWTWLTVTLVVILNTTCFIRPWH